MLLEPAPHTCLPRRTRLPPALPPESKLLGSSAWVESSSADAEDCQRRRLVPTTTTVDAPTTTVDAPTTRDLEAVVRLNHACRADKVPKTIRSVQCCSHSRLHKSAHDSTAHIPRTTLLRPTYPARRRGHPMTRTSSTSHIRRQRQSNPTITPHRRTQVSATQARRFIHTHPFSPSHASVPCVQISHAIARVGRACVSCVHACTCTMLLAIDASMERPRRPR